LKRWALQLGGALTLAGLTLACASGQPLPLRQTARAAADPGSMAAEQSADMLRSVVAASRLAELRWPDFSDYHAHVQALYEAQGWKLLWTKDGKPTRQARDVIGQLAKAAEAGLRPEDYDAAALSKRLDAVSGKTSPAELAKLDVALSVALMRNISDLHIGRVNPERAGFQLDVGPKKYDLPLLVGELAVSSEVLPTLARVEPQFSRYVQLKQALPRYRALAADPKLMAPPELPKLRPGDRNPGVPALRRWLVALGDLPAQDPVSARSEVYSGELAAAVKRFQERHGFTPDGVIGAATAKALHVSAAERVRQIELALERWRWLPDSFPHPPIVVNIPEFRLYGLQGTGDRITAEGALTMRVIVGKALETQTPVFSSDMEYVIFRPYWSVPYSIVKKEMIDKIRKDPGYLGRENLEIVNNANAVRYTGAGALAGLSSGALGIRQRPGPKNSLGLVKFIFPNDESVYLHGTPAKELFARQRRDFSHGCIRVEDPVALAEYVLKGVPGWSRERIEKAMSAGGTSQVDLADPIPVYIVYMTATARPGGEVDFFEDLYGHDAALEGILAKGPPYTEE
jgi:murein L,D-transpeptidase YcbB/YkuD